MKIRLKDIAGNVLREISVTGPPDGAVPPVIVMKNREDYHTYTLERRDVEPGTHDYIAVRNVLVLE